MGSVQANPNIDSIVGMAGGIATGHRPPSVVLVDDDRLYAEALAAELAVRKITTRHFASAGAFLNALDDVMPTTDVVLLDWQLESSCGLGLLVTLQRRGIRLPVIFLTNFAAVDHEMQALDKGATDFVDKCRGVETLVRRLQLAVAADPLRHGETNSRRGDDKRLTLCRRLSRVTWRGVEIHLTRGEFNMLELLVLNAGDYVPYDDLYEAQQATRIASSAVSVNVRSAIKRVRNRFRSVDADFDEIESYVGFGYRWRI